MGARTFLFVVLLSFISLCSSSSFVGLEKNIDSVSYGLLDTKTGASTIKSKLNLAIFNAPQFAYSSTNQQYTFVAYDIDNYNAYLITLNASTGAVVYNVSITNPPYPFGMQYGISSLKFENNTELGVLYGQVWYNNGTATLTSIDPKTSATQNIGFYFDASFNGQSTFWTFVDCTYDLGTHTYYTLYISPSSQVLVGVTVFNGLVTMNLTLNLNMSQGNAFGLQYNNYTNTFYVLGFNNVTLAYDLAIINQANGDLEYLNLFTNRTGLDSVNNILSIVNEIDYTTIIANVDLKAKTIIGITKVQGDSISSMLALSTLN